MGRKSYFWYLLLLSIWKYCKVEFAQQQSLRPGIPESHDKKEARIRDLGRNNRFIHLLTMPFPLPAFLSNHRPKTPLMVSIIS